MLQTFHDTKKDVDELREHCKSLQSASDAESAAQFTSQTQQLVSRLSPDIVAIVLELMLHVSLCCNSLNLNSSADVSSHLIN